MLPGGPTLTIRIQFVIATLEVGGAERQVTALAAGLDSARFEAEVLVLTRGGRFEEPLQAAGIPYHILDKRPGIDPFVLPKLWRHMRRFKPDIVHGWMFTGGAFGRTAGLLSRVPVLIMSERTAHMRRTRLHRRVDMTLARRTDVTLGNSTAVEEWFRGYARVTSGRTEVIPNGLDLSSFSVSEAGPDNVVPIVMTVCRMSEVKRLDVLLDAARILVDAGVSFQLELVGDGECRPDVEAQITALSLRDVVVCHGAQKDVNPCLQRADVFVLTSDHEGLPNAVMEAMATGVPVDCGDSQGVADGIRAMLEDSSNRRKMGMAGRRLIESEFSMEAMVARHEALYEECVARLR